MDKPEEVEFAKLLFGGIAAMILLALAIVLFAIIYQRKLYAQQAQLHQLELSRQKEITESVVRSQERERERIARDLHDEVGASLSTAKLFVNQIQHETAVDDIKELAQQAGGILGDMVQDVRQIAQNLSPVILDNVGLSDAVKLIMNRLQLSGLQVSSQIEPVDKELDKEKQLALYRIVQEVVGNIVKHAGATHVALTLACQDNTIRLQIDDDGRGFLYPQPDLSARSGMGMGSIRARAGLLNAQLHITSAVGKGTRIELNIPVLPPSVS
ncbi:sensor histidine kinase [Spirosoma validum]|uniref:histidine kinase n=1 Tax=Spirosoma validum TaxID=2771355 RepID=A0A927GF32_9BACT|nr:sensor histidine kinase [Spirosoma validum]MBD2755452.1 sensor histidine kinase [Spirosoma validum]